MRASILSIIAATCFLIGERRGSDAQASLRAQLMSAPHIFRTSHTQAALIIIAAAALSVTMLSGLQAQGTEQKLRPDGAQELAIPADGSLQNAAWSPDGAQIMFTRFRGGYNKSPADILIFDLQTKAFRTLVEDGHTNVSAPGSTWNARTGRIVFSSTRSGHDEIFSIASQGRSEAQQLTSDNKYMSYEPSMSPDGQSIVYESHVVNEEGHGRLRLLRLGASEPEELTHADEDCRQSNWSPAGNVIVYQKKHGDQWDLWIYDISSKEHRQLTQGDGDKTDATFSPDGRWVLYSADNSNLKHASLFVTSLDGTHTFQVTDGDVYDGAASWSPDGKTIVFESAAVRGAQPGWHLDTMGQPQASTSLWNISTPDVVFRQLCLGSAVCR
jgi:TolB protein